MDRNVKLIFHQCRKRGLALSIVGDRVVARPEDRVDYAFKEVLRMFRFELLAELNRREERVRHLCTQILCGEFEGASAEQWEKLDRQLDEVVL